MIRKAFFLMGPTAIGKTDLAIELVQKFPMEIISVDSAMVYKGLDIGSGKPTQAELAKAPHRLIDIREPSEPYSAADFCDDALKAMDEIHKQNKIPLLVGGTMMYFRALQFGLSPLPSADPELRKQLEEKAKKLGWEAMHKELEQVDPVSSKRINCNDTQRIQRALEIYLTTGQPMSELWAETEKKALPYEITALGLVPEDRAMLHERIAKRFDSMLELGLVEEVKQLIEKPGMHADLPALRSVGYRQVLEYHQGDVDFETMRDKACAATRQLAKRQLTWLRSWPDLVTFTDPKEIHDWVSKNV